MFTVQAIEPHAPPMAGVWSLSLLPLSVSIMGVDVWSLTKCAWRMGTRRRVYDDDSGRTGTGLRRGKSCFSLYRWRRMLQMRRGRWRACLGFISGLGRTALKSQPEHLVAQGRRCGLVRMDESATNKVMAINRATSLPLAVTKDGCIGRSSGIAFQVTTQWGKAPRRNTSHCYKRQTTTIHRRIVFGVRRRRLRKSPTRRWPRGGSYRRHSQAGELGQMGPSA